MSLSNRKIVPVPVSSIETLHDGRVRFVMTDGRRLTMNSSAIEIGPGHVFIPEAFAIKIGAITAKNIQAVP